ncbi:alpha-L-arabinofuranosidase C-terminal domain-containing protein [Bifidobacterium callitrichos]|uniref:non-reducing end alpha-L-arabinofuranosidase n=1 Tax=Bifidobacterium callitrichos DSM 23973 TaxID=1437609 RepID=A0A087A618_9BIFI|nr:alpha-L-arabinofuranosidase C-terminal domain-containing protein [Bifidobacterium callitrichos]KFI54218.1 alpha-arabinofuranosidase I [Bifidobacterium callitrichos DSM 23973]
MTDSLIATLDKTGERAISTDLWGVFFEDISYSADGGLNSELVQNGAFEYNRADREGWSNYSFWRKIVPAGTFAAFAIRDVAPVADENPHYAVAEIGKVGEPGDPLIAAPALENVGFDGMTFRAGETYDFSIWTRAHGTALPIAITLIGDDGETLASATVHAPASAANGEWTQLHAELSVPGTSGEAVSDASGDPAAGDVYAGKPVVARQGVLRLVFPETGVIDLDFVSLEPRTTYKGLEHFRPDLVKALADLKPRFMRFPGGCVAHGLGIDNMYHWDRTIGPVEHRPHDFNVWGYHQSFRLGYYEYLRLCETIGAKPLPVLAAGVSCQNTSQGPVPIALEDMPAYIDEVLALIDFCNADPATNQWAAKRAAMGHPEPFGLEYLGIGNEDLIDDVFKDRFERIFDVVKAAHPEITVVGTIGPAPAGRDYEQGWDYARKARIPIVDEHSYQSSSWWFHNLDHYDLTDREGPKVYLGEYGSWGTGLINGLSEAAFMGRAMELNGDVVHMASYAPLFCKNGHDSWNPDLIYFDNEHVYRPYSYWVQKMFANTTADTAWLVALSGPTTLRRDLPNRIGLRVGGGAKADITDLSIETADGRRVDLPDVEYRGSGVTLPTPDDLAADAYTIHATVTYYEGMWGVGFDFGDIDGKNHSGASFGRGFALRLVRDGSGYNLANTESSMDAVQPGTVWHARIEVADRGESLALYIDDQLVIEGREIPEEPRRTVSVSRDSAAGVDYIRVVNALPDAVDVDLTQVLESLGLGATSDGAAVTATATVLTGDDPYAGNKGAESPTAPVVTNDVVLAGSAGKAAYTAPAWSFTVLAIRH